MTSRLSLKAAVTAVLIGLLGTAGSTNAQDAAPPPAAVEPAVATPTAPRPYLSLQRRTRPRPVAPRVAPPPVAPVAPAPAAAPPVQGVTPLAPQQLEAFVDGVVRRSMDRDHIAGVTVSVVQNGQVVLKKGYGVADLQTGRPVDPDRTLFRIASISKTFTWIALMNEIESGRMRLDAPVNLYLPEPLQVQSRKVAVFWDTNQPPVRLKDLMTHTSGFEDRSLGQLFEKDWRRVRPLTKYLRQERPRRVRNPGVLPAYSNYGVALAGAALSNVTGKPYEDLIAQRIILPAGMNHTTFREARPWHDDLPAPMAPALAADLSQGFSWTPQGWTVRPAEFMGQVAPAASASSTAGDMARYMTLLLNGGVIDGKTLYSPAIAQAFRTPMYRPSPDAAGWNAGFQDIALPGGHRGFGHGGATLYFFSNMVIAPDLGLGIFVSTNTESGSNLSNTLPSKIVEQFYAPAPAAPAVSAITRDQAKAFEGEYLTTRRAYGGLEAFTNRIVGRAKVVATPEGRLALITDDGSNLWNGTRQPGVFRSVSGPETLVFDVEGGKAVRFYAPRGWSAFERVGGLKTTGPLVWIAVLSGFAALATVLGVFMRDRRELRQTPTQARASLIQTTQAVLWLVAALCMSAFSSKASDTTAIFFGWPSGWLMTASACALVASVLTVISLVLTPFVWRGGRRVDSWSSFRKLGFTCTVLLYSALGVLLAMWNFLLPWAR